MARIRTVAVIGGGVAGLAAARRLAVAGFTVTIFDKGRRPGGRLSTRHAEGFVFNHGCQFFTAHHRDFAAAVTPAGQDSSRPALSRGAKPHGDPVASPSALWDGGDGPKLELAASASVSALWPAAGSGCWVGVPDMSAVAFVLAEGLAVRSHAHVRAIERADGCWRLYFDNGVEGPFDTAILAVPAPQAVALLANMAPHRAARLAAVRMAPCWAVMLGFDEHFPGPAIERRSAGPISWLARESSRPAAARHGVAGPLSYTIHASAAWSNAHLERAAASIVRELTAAAGLPAKPVYAAAHRWRYALVESPLGEPFLWDEALALGLCGDWCLGGRLEAAYLSGRALGIRLSQ